MGRISAAQAAAARLAAAAAGSDKGELGAAIAAFEDLCKPGGWGGPLRLALVKRLAPAHARCSNGRSAPWAGLGGAFVGRDQQLDAVHPGL